MRWLLAIAVLLLTAFVFDLGLLVYAAYAVAGVIALTWWLTRRWADSIVTERQCSIDEAEIGDVVEVIDKIGNTGRLPIAWVLVEDVLPPEIQVFKPARLEVEGERIDVFRLGVEASHELRYRLRCRRRGYYQIGPMLVETGDMFGLFRRFKVASEPHFLTVLPKPVTLHDYNVASRRPIGEIHLQHRAFEDPTRIAGVRRYERGDPLNRVHWRATARTGELHSKIYEPSAMAGATIVLDFHRGSHDPRHEPYRSEIAITAAVSVAHTIYTMGQQIGLISNGRDAVDRIREEGWRGQARTRDQARSSVSMRTGSDRLRPIVVPTATGVERFFEIQRTLARIELHDGLSLAQLLVECESQLPRDAAVIVILAQLDEGTAIALSGLRRRGYFVTAIINEYDGERFARRAGPLVASGIRCLQLRDEESLSELCRSAWFGR